MNFDTIIVSLAVMGGAIALIGVPVRCWQYATGRLRSQIPRHAIANATFSIFSVLFYVPAMLSWVYAVYAAYVDYTCVGACEHRGVGTAIALGILGCAYALLEGFLLTARRRTASQPSLTRR